MDSKAVFYNKKTYTAYREFIKTRPKEHKIKGRDNLGALHVIFWKVVQEMMLESTGGVLMDKMGYFFILKTVKKIKMSRAYMPDFVTHNLHTDGYMYNPSFLPCKRSPFVFWNIDCQFGGAVRQKLCENLRNGYLYKMHASSLRNFLTIDNGQNRRNNSTNKKRPQ